MRVRRLVARLLVVLLLVILLAGVGAYLALNHTPYLGNRLEQEATRYVEGKLVARDASLSLWNPRVEFADVRLQRGDSDVTPALAIDSMSVGPPVQRAQDGRFVPGRIDVRGATLALTEFENGRIEPLDLLKPFPPTDVLPTVAIEDGTIELTGSGPLCAAFDRFLRADLPRRATGVTLLSVPAPVPAPDLLALSGALALPGNVALTLRGAVGRDEVLRLVVEAQDVDLGEAALRDALAPEARRFLDGHLLGGRVDAHATVHATMDGPGAIGVELAVRDATLLHYGFDRPFEHVDAIAAFDGSTLHVPRIVVQDGAYRLDGAATIEEPFGAWRIRAHARGRGLSFDESFAAALVHPLVRPEVEAYDPNGTFDFDLEVAAEQGRMPHVRWRINPVAADGAFVGTASLGREGGTLGFPYRLREVRGEICGDGLHFEIRNVTGTHNGGGRAVIDGFVDVLPDDEYYTVRVQATDVPIDDDLLHAVHAGLPEARPLLERLALAGRIDLDVTVKKEVPAPGEPPPLHETVTGRFTLRGASVTFDGFPLPIEEVEGSVALDGKRLELRELRGRHEGARIELNGTIDATDAADPGLDLRIRATDLTADAALAKLLEDASPRARELWKLARPAGPFDVDLDVKKEPRAEGRFRALVSPKGMGLLPDWLALPIEGVFGRVEFGAIDPAADGDAVVIDSLEGRLAPAGAVVRGSGHISGENVARLELEARDMQLDGELLARLLEPMKRRDDRAGAMARMLDGLAPSGRVSVRLVTGGDGAPEGVEIGFDELALTADWLPPGGVTSARGALSVETGAGRARFTDVGALLGATDTWFAAAELDVQMDDAGALRVSGRDATLSPLQLDGDVLRWLVEDASPGAWEAIAVLAPSGSVDVRLESFDVELAPEFGARAATCRGTMVLKDCAIERPVPLRDLRGDLFIESVDHADGRRGLHGSVAGLGFAVYGVQVDDLGARFETGPGGLLVHEVEGGFAGGRLPAVENYLRIEAGGAESFEGRVSLRDADIAQLFRTRVSDPEELSGRLSLDAHLRGSAASPTTIAGTGTVRIEDGNLWALPTFAQLYRFSIGTLLGDRGKPVFDRGGCAFELRQGSLILDEVRLESAVLTLDGEGVAGPTGMDVVIMPEWGTAGIPLVSPLLDYVTKRMVGYRVFGPWGNPRVAAWRSASDLDSEAVTHTSRLVPRKPLDWQRRF